MNDAVPNPVLSSGEAAVWLRFVEDGRDPEAVAAAVRKLHGLVRAGKLKPLADIVPLTP